MRDFLTRPPHALLLRCAAGAALAAAFLASPAECGAQTGAWSQTVDGIRGRLIALPRDSAGTRQLRIDVEVENLADMLNPIEIWWSTLSSMLDFQVEDEQGAPLQKLPPAPRSEYIPYPTGLILPKASSLRVTVTTGAFAYLARPDRTHFQVAFQLWDLTQRSPAPLYLSATFRPRPTTDTAYRQGTVPWVGALALPRVRIR